MLTKIAIATCHVDILYYHWPRMFGEIYTTIIMNGKVSDNGKGCHNVPKIKKSSQANNADPDQTAPKEQSDQDLHCLLFSLRFWIRSQILKIKFKF